MTSNTLTEKTHVDKDSDEELDYPLLKGLLLPDIQGFSEQI